VLFFPSKIRRVIIVGAKVSIVLASAMLLTGCSSGSPAEVAQDLSVNVELWGDNFVLTENGNCKGSPSFDGNFENNSTVVLVGPDDSEISAVTFGVGQLTETTIAESNVSNFPDGNICRFDVTFSNVPTLATYRIKTRDGEISSVSWSLDDVKQENWDVGIVYGADFID
jgi:hypothetical protein